MQQYSTDTNTSRYNASVPAAQIFHLRLMLNGGDGALKGGRQVNMEEQLVNSLHNRTAQFRTLLEQVVVEVRAGPASRLIVDGLDIVVVDDGAVLAHVLPAETPRSFSVRGISSRRRIAAQRRNVEDRPPRLEAFVGGQIWTTRVAESSCGEGTPGPARVDTREMPFDDVGRGMAIELVPDVDEVLDGGRIHVVHGGEVEDDGFEMRSAVVDLCLVTGLWTRIVPWSVLGDCR